jgi:hypothetical protein
MDPGCTREILFRAKLSYTAFIQPEIQHGLLVLSFADQLIKARRK